MWRRVQAPPTCMLVLVLVATVVLYQCYPQPYPLFLCGGAPHHNQRWCTRLLAFSDLPRAALRNLPCALLPCSVCSIPQPTGQACGGSVRSSGCSRDVQESECTPVARHDASLTCGQGGIGSTDPLRPSRGRSTERTGTVACLHISSGSGSRAGVSLMQFLYTQHYTTYYIT